MFESFGVIHTRVQYIISSTYLSPISVVHQGNFIKALPHRQCITKRGLSIDKMLTIIIIIR